MLKNLEFLSPYTGMIIIRIAFVCYKVQNISRHIFQKEWSYLEFYTTHFSNKLFNGQYRYSSLFRGQIQQLNVNNWRKQQHDFLHLRTHTQNMLEKE